MNDFDGIARYYDRLKKLVFGNQVNAATHYYLPEIKPNAKVLIIGGGTGEILMYLPPDLFLTYVEKSSSMIRRANQKRASGIDFIQLDFKDFDTEAKYDYVICPFFLDLFDNNELVAIVERITKLLREDGKLLITDFKGEGRSQQLLIWLMYRFFRLSANIQARHLPDIDQIITHSNFQRFKSRQFSHGLIFSHIYQYHGK